ncbi:PEPxxWA-CTERM sorting domain-containing protein [Sphingomonas sp. BIUV-7]|uniref:PEPxxWA-CTERM sorting domain-containing protein n=1 Tax=Sphingomonas natans TaxID=3063330 RepID=A0ABT8YF12_9SPHN|nr:PEPxxWA-CTERM sorting domain-containing protein [Sphingomonas sp. BIUV-7]MDO6416906.1 PEPxxWA-CTERM sorting domain-containing protein [Sphingomonas sp. BIUV-7]
MRNIIGLIAKGGARAAITASFAVATTGSALAVTSISSNATDLKVSLGIATIPVGVTIGTSSGTAAPAYSASNSVASVNQSLALGGVVGGPLSQGLTTGVMTTSAQSAFPVSPTGSASATINNLGLGLAINLGVLGSLNALSLGSSAVTSTTTFDGSNFTGVSSVADLALNSLILSLPINAGIYASTAANRTLIDILGLKITLNEQIATDLTSAGLNTRSFTTNALRVTYTDFLVGGALLNGDVIVGQSQVSVTQAVPEPATWSMMILGFGMVGGALRHQRRAVRALA